MAADPINENESRIRELKREGEALLRRLHEIDSQLIWLTGKYSSVTEAGRRTVVVNVECR